MCFSLCKRPITLDILLPILVKWNLKLRLLSSVRPKKLTRVYTQWVTHLNQSATEVLLFVACEIT